MVMARWPRPSNAPASAASAVMAAAPRAASHRAVALGLEDEAALEFERRAEQHRKHDRLAQKLRHWRRITVARKNRIDRRAEAHDTPPQIERLDLEGQDRVICGGRRRRACWNFGAGIGHDA